MIILIKSIDKGNDNSIKETKKGKFNLKRKLGRKKIIYKYIYI